MPPSASSSSPRSRCPMSIGATAKAAERGGGEEEGGGVNFGLAFSGSLLSNLNRSKLLGSIAWLHRIASACTTMFSAAFPSVFDAASSDGTSDSESEQHTAIAPLSKRPLSDRLDTAATAMLGEMAEQLEVIEPPAKRARVPDLDTGVNAMLGEILSHELPPLDDGSLEAPRRAAPRAAIALDRPDFFLTNSRRRSSRRRRPRRRSHRRPLQPPAAAEERRRRRRRRRRQPQGLGAVGGRGDPQLVESKAEWRAIAAMLPGCPTTRCAAGACRAAAAPRTVAASAPTPPSAPPPRRRASRTRARAAPELDGGGGRSSRSRWARRATGGASS